VIQDEAREADELADAVNRLAANYRSDPERFHVARDDIAKRLRRMAKRLRGDPRRSDDTRVWRP
jgi:hypothetical protein